ncbi:hypothetical protein Tco_1556840 [Tanacetum coccineum]
MANKEQNPPQQEQTFVAAKQVGFNLEDIILNTNNEVSLLYPEHNNKDYFKCVFSFISKCCLREPFTISPNMYKEHLAEFWYSAKALENSKVSFSVPTGGIYGEVGVNTFRNAIGAHYLPHSSEYVAPPSIDVVRQWFPTIGYGEEVSAKGTLRKSIIPPSLANGINIDYANIFWEDIIIKLKKKQREKVVSYTRFLSLLMTHKMKEGYRDGELTLYLIQVFSVNNWALKPNQPEEPLFTDHMLAICSETEPVVFKAPKPSSNVERVPQSTKPGAKPGHKKYLTSSKQPSVSNKEATKGGSSKAPTNSGMHKEDQQATGDPTFLGVTSEARANPQLNSGNDALAVSTAEADPGNSAPSDFVPQQQGMNEGTKNTSYVHLFVGTDPHVLTDQTKYVSKGLETILTQPIIGKGASSVARQVEEEEASSAIKLEDLAKLVSNVQPSFKDLDSSEDDPVIVVNDSDKDGEDEVHATTHSQKHKLELEKNKAEAEAALFKAQPSFPNVGQLNELLVKSLQTEFLKNLFAHDFSSSLPIELKDLPYKFNELTEEVKGLKKQVASVQAKLKTLDAFVGLLLNVTKALNKFAHVLDSASSKAGDQSVPSVGQADTMPADAEKNTNQATIS